MVVESIEEEKEKGSVESEGGEEDLDDGGENEE